MRIVDKTVKTLFEKEHTMQSIYQTMHRVFGKRVFAEHLRAEGIESMSFVEMDRLTHCYASYIKNAVDNTYVGLYAKNSEQWICAFWGILMAGHTPVLLNTSIDDASVLSVMADFALDTVVVDKQYPLFALQTEIQTVSFAEMEAAEYRPFEEDWCDRFGVSTSGTEGKPKSYLFDGEAMCAQILISQEVLAANPVFSCYHKKDTVKLLAFLPFYHIFGLITLVIWFSFFGRTLVFPLDDSPKEMQRACKEAKVTHFFAVPVVWNTLVKKLEAELARQGETERFEKGIKTSISLQKAFPRFGQWFAKQVIFKKVTDSLFGPSLQLAISGGAFLPPHTLCVINSLGYNLLNGYGSTEAGIVSVNIAKRIDRRIRPDCGDIFSSVRYRIDPQTGELLLNGNTLYCAKQVQGKTIPRNGKEIGTNDIATLNGRTLTLEGRLDEMIIGPNGENLSPDSIENFFASVGADDYCVISYESKAVLIINKSSVKTTIKQLQNLVMDVNKEIPLTQRVHEVRLVDIPCRTSAGKANRKVLSEGMRNKTLPYDVLSAEPREQSASPEAVVIRNAIASVLSLNPNEIDDFDDFFINLGGNSLQYFELISLLSQHFDTQIQFVEKIPSSVQEIRAVVEQDRSRNARQDHPSSSEEASDTRSE